MARNIGLIFKAQHNAILSFTMFSVESIAQEKDNKDTRTSVTHHILLSKNCFTFLKGMP